MSTVVADPGWHLGKRFIFCWCGETETEMSPTLEWLHSLSHEAGDRRMQCQDEEEWCPIARGLVTWGTGKEFFHEGGEALPQVAQDSWLPQGQAGQGLGEPCLIEGATAHGREVAQDDL